jgi:hypothetical protein
MLPRCSGDLIDQSFADLIRVGAALVLGVPARYRSLTRKGAIAQLVERFHGMEEARSSILLSSTISLGISCRCGGFGHVARFSPFADCRLASLCEQRSNR